MLRQCVPGLDGKRLPDLQHFAARRKSEPGGGTAGAKRFPATEPVERLNADRNRLRQLPQQLCATPPQRCSGELFDRIHQPGVPLLQLPVVALPLGEPPDADPLPRVAPIVIHPDRFGHFRRSGQNAANDRNQSSVTIGHRPAGIPPFHRNATTDQPNRLDGFATAGTISKPNGIARNNRRQFSVNFPVLFRQIRFQQHEIPVGSKLQHPNCDGMSGRIPQQQIGIFQQHMSGGGDQSRTFRPENRAPAGETPSFHGKLRHRRRKRHGDRQNRQKSNYRHVFSPCILK